MVRHTLSWILILSICIESTALAVHQGFAVHWKGARSESCQRLVEAFLYELRSTAPEHAIELEVTEGMPRKLAATDPAQPAPRMLEVECDSGDARALKVNARKLRYLAKANGFEATDWLAFQRTELAQEEPELPAINLAPQPRETELANREPAQLATAEVGGKSIFKRWWFWALVGGAGAGIFAVTQLTKGSPSGGINVEIH